MLLRLLFVLLIALNIAVAAWLLLGDTGTHAVDPVDKGVPALKLLAELPAHATTAPAPAASAPAVAPSASASAKVAAVTPATPARPASTPTPPPAPTPPPPQRSYRCLAVGPFASQVDLRAARTALASRTVRARQRQEQTTESHGWRVYLPSQASRDQAVAQARRLEAKGIKDYFVVGAQGDLPNSVSLGLFHDPANARKRRDEVVAAGFPARMSERTETVPVWWLDVVVPEDSGADVRRAVRAPGITTRTTGCF
ncbi:SPOR domain-containing protein [Luteibacter sahnii]|uniref:SPOR domain-containing protein n=1 Tax=Luteibacter sahnii TaxID=3021977 RepID=UPI002A69DC7F|nr:SPOR domain-containing protein [Luteibacter sp. PPL193]MDY1546770.1 SPOR domain-containing protein [Luteibacter sp. PPL193]